jgi:hypothetical protein
MTKPNMTIKENWICKLFGHKYNSLQLLMMKIEMEAIYLSPNIKPSLTCQRCGKQLFIKDLTK